jgi:hypothetical protein
MRISLHCLVKVNVITVIFRIRYSRLTAAMKLSEDRRICVMARLRTVFTRYSKAGGKKL